MTTVDDELRSIEERLKPREPTPEEVLESLGVKPQEPPEPTSAIAPVDTRTPLEKLRDILYELDRKYCSWADTKPVQVVVIVAIILSTVGLVNWVITPDIRERQRLYQEGYEACKARVEAELSCE